MEFKDKVVIVTGGGRGIGAETAIRYARSGAKVALFDLSHLYIENIAKQIEQEGSECLTCRVDVMDLEAVQKSVKEVYEKFGQIDILVNNAGVLKDNISENMTLEEWDFVIDINLKGSFICSQAVQKYMKQQQYGKIVMVSSQAALGASGRANYAAAKAGVQGLTRTLSMELGKYGINVNAVAPGYIETEMSKVSEDFSSRRGIQDFSTYKQRMIEQNPIPRTGKPEDVANVVLFLSSDASSYVTGQIIYVTGAP